jgi:branched-chain amino acid transport system ATP-binding protein
MLLEASALRVDYGGHLALDGVSCGVREGEILLVAGHNGAGKTTLLRAFLGMVPLQDGRILFSGQEVSAFPAHRRLELGVALVPQGRGSFPNLTVAENLTLAGSRGTATRTPLEVRREKVHALFPALARFGRRAAGGLSGGQQQMLAIGMTLMKEPRLLLLDEPSIGLAPKLVDEIFELVARIRAEQGITTILVEQNVGHAARICGRVLILNAGRIARELAPGDLTDAVLWESF